MIHELYSRDLMDDLKRSGTRNAIFSVVGLILVFAVCTVFCFFLNEENVFKIKLINIVLSCVGGFVALYRVLDYVIPAFSRRRYIARLLAPVRHTVTGKVEDTGRISTVAAYVTARELMVTDEGGRISFLYWENELPYPDFEGKLVTLYTVQNRIVAFEVAE